MKNIYLQLLMSVMLISLTGCVLPQVIQSLNLYDISSGTTIELFFNQTSRDHGTISSSAGDEQYHGECSFSAERGYPPPYPPSQVRHGSDTVIVKSSKDFAEVYGFSKDIEARPVGTGIIVGNHGTVIELVFYHFSSEFRTGDIQSADGVGRDNSGRYYRVFLSTQGE